MNRVIEMRPARQLKKNDEVEGFGVLTYVSALAPNDCVYVWRAEEDGRNLWPASAMVPVLLPDPRYWTRTITYVTESEATADAWRNEVGKAETTTTQARVSTRVFGEVVEECHA